LHPPPNPPAEAAGVDGQPSRAVRVTGRGTELWLGEGLAEDELQWVAEEIAEYLHATRTDPPDTDRGGRWP